MRSLNNTIWLGGALSLALLPVAGRAQEQATGMAGQDAPHTTIARPSGPVHRLTAFAVAANHASASSKGKARAAANTTQDSAITVLVRANTEVKDRVFTLGEIADFESKSKSGSAGTKALLAQLASVEIGVSPLPGQARLLYPGDVTVHLRAAHLGDLLNSKRIELIAPPEMRVTRMGHDVSNDEITQAAITSALAAIKDIPNATLEPVPFTGKFTIPTGKVRVVAGAYRGEPTNGTLTVPVSLMVDGRAVQTAEVLLRVHRRMTVVVARRTIEPHDLLTAGDVMLAKIELPAGFDRPMLDVQEAIGKRATRRILSDAPLATNFLETPPDVLANARLTIEYVYGSVRITAPGLARQTGMIGDTIRVYATDTHKELEAVIVDEHTVRLTQQEDGQ